MPEAEVDLPDRIDGDIDRLVERGDFVNRDQAVEELLTLGLLAHDTVEEPPPGMDEELFTQAIDDQQDPAQSN